MGPEFYHPQTEEELGALFPSYFSARKVGPLSSTVTETSKEHHQLTCEVMVKKKSATALGSTQDLNPSQGKHETGHPGTAPWEGVE